MNFYTTESYENQKGYLQHIKIECRYVANKNDKGFERIYLKQREFEEKLDILMKEMEMKYLLPF